jgi:hypothetical protein
MWYPFYWALLKHRSRGGGQVKTRRRRLDGTVDVDTINWSEETVAQKVKGPSGDVMKRPNVANHAANHGSVAKDSGHFAVVRTLIRRSTGYDVHSLAPCCPSMRLTVGMPSPVHRETLDSALIAQAAVPYCILKDPSLTEYLQSRPAEEIAEPSSVMRTCARMQAWSLITEAFLDVLYSRYLVVVLFVVPRLRSARADAACILTSQAF